MVTASLVGIVDAEGEGLKGRTTLDVLPLRYRAECRSSSLSLESKGKESPLAISEKAIQCLTALPVCWVNLCLLSLTHTQVLAPVAEKLTVVCVWWHHPLVEAMGLITEGAWTSPRAGTPLKNSSHRSFQICVFLRDPNPCLPRVSIFQSSVGES